MTTRTWVGGSSGNSASDPANWSPTGTPQPGDSLFMNAGTINVSDNALANNVLTLNSEDGTTINLDDASAKIQGASSLTGIGFNVNATGFNALNILSPEPGLTSPSVDLSAHSFLLLSGDLDFFSYNIQGGSGSAIINQGTLSYLAAGTQIIDTSLLGKGAVDVTRGHDGPGGVEVNGVVGPRQTFDLSTTDFTATLQIDHPREFFGLVNIEPVAPVSSEPLDVVLQGVTATSYDIRNDLLLLFNGGKITDVLRLANPASEPLSVGQSGSNVVLAFNSTAPGVILPMRS
jgi:hypothetical protein